jgi:hypothetical protein
MKMCAAPRTVPKSVVPRAHLTHTLGAREFRISSKDRTASALQARLASEWIRIAQVLDDNAAHCAHRALNPD